MSIRSWPQRDCGPRLQTFAALAIELQKSVAGESNKIISQEMAGKMLTPGTGNWGLGVGLGAPTEGREKIIQPWRGQQRLYLHVVCLCE